MITSAPTPEPVLTAGLLELFPTAAFTCAADGTITHHNRLAVELWGRAPEPGETEDEFSASFRLYDADGRLRARGDTPMREALRTGKPVRGALLVIERADGSRTAALVSVEALRDGAGGIIGTVNAFQDATPAHDAAGAERVVELVKAGSGGRRASDAPASRDGADFRELADAMPQIVWSSGPDGHIDYFNRRWFEFTGVMPGATGDDSWLPVLHPADRQRSRDLWYRSIHTGQPFEVEYRLGHPGETDYRWHLARALPARDADGAITRWYGTATDIHDQKRAEEALRHARTEAEQANRAKMEFLAVVSHELRTPLNAIGGYAELLELGIHGPLTEAQRGALARIRRSKHHLLNLINDVLSYASLESGGLRYDVTDVRVLDVLKEADAMVLPQMEAKKLTYDYSGCTGDVMARADRERMHQILLNLLSNAAKFTPARGHVAVSCESAGGLVYVHVSDDGPGIPPDKHEMIFEPFVQLSPPLTRAEHGVGLGLSISRDLARGMGGDLNVQSTLGRGATFTLQLLSG